MDLNINETIRLTDGNYRYCEHGGSIIKLRNIATGEYVHMHVAELSQRMVGLPANLHPALDMIESLPEKTQKSTLAMGHHIEELVTGLHPQHPQPRPEYDPEKHSLNERINTKVDELRRIGVSASRATLNRRIKAFRERGPAGLVDNRLIREDGPLSRLDDRVIDVLCEIIANQKDQSTGTISRVIRQTRTTVLKRHGLTMEDLPSDASFYRYISILGKGKHITGSAGTRRSAGNRPDRTFGKRNETLPGAEMQMDSTPLDLLVLSPTGKVVRPTCTILVDKATRSIVAFTIRIKATKGVDHARLLAQAFTPPQNRPDKTRFRRIVQGANPGVALLDPARRRQLELARPFIRPETIVIDNGADYAGNPFVLAAERLHVSLRFAAPYTGSDKPIVERTFHSMKTMLIEDLPGYVGRTPDHRGRDIDKQDLMDIYALHEVIDDWILNVWNYRPHDELHDLLQPGVSLTPLQKYHAAIRVVDSISLPLSTEQYIALLPSDFREIGSTGVQVDNRHFDSPELHPFRNTKSTVRGKGRKGKWEIKHDPYNPQQAWVRSPEGEWIRCGLRGDDLDLRPYSDTMRATAFDQERADVATVGAALTGNLIPDHAALEPEDFADEWEDDLDDEALKPFDPTKEY